MNIQLGSKVELKRFNGDHVSGRVVGLACINSELQGGGEVMVTVHYKGTDFNGLLSNTKVIK